MNLLTDEEISKLFMSEFNNRIDTIAFARAIEAAVLAKVGKVEDKCRDGSCDCCWTDKATKVDVEPITFSDSTVVGTTGVKSEPNDPVGRAYIEPVAWHYPKTGQVFSTEPPPGLKAQCDELVPASALAALRAENERLTAEWAALSQDEGKAEREIEKLRAERDRNLDSIQVNNNIINKKNAEIAALRQENDNLRTVMMAAAVEITEHWDAHCDSEGYGPANLVRRLENGYPAQYGYDAESYVRVERERDTLRTQLQEAQEQIAAITGLLNNQEDTEKKLIEAQTLNAELVGVLKEIGGLTMSMFYTPHDMAGYAVDKANKTIAKVEVKE